MGGINFAWLVWHLDEEKVQGQASVKMVMVL